MLPCLNVPNKLLILLSIPWMIMANPWGKDADLVDFRPCQEQAKIAKPRTLLAEAGIKCIRFHQVVISPADGPRSHFIPCSSKYALDAMKKYGFFTGVCMGCDRLMRENDDPWIYRPIHDSSGKKMKWDPVP